MLLDFWRKIISIWMEGGIGVWNYIVSESDVDVGEYVDIVEE